MSRTLVLCWLNDFKMEGKILHVTEDPIVLQLQDLIHMWKEMIEVVRYES